jgi:orotate phosphoribosyltransferase
MVEDIFATIPARSGHFLLESGYHTDFWFELDGLFVDPDRCAPLIGALSERLDAYDISGVCGPLLGGAFLAQAIAIKLRKRFYYTQPVTQKSNQGLYRAEYHLPPELRAHIKGERVALVDDVISAGSSVRATHAVLTAAGAEIVVVGTLMLLGSKASPYFSELGVPVEASERREFNLWSANNCPMCRLGTALEDPVAKLNQGHSARHC